MANRFRLNGDIEGFEPKPQNPHALPQIRVMNAIIPAKTVGNAQ